MYIGRGNYAFQLFYLKCYMFLRQNIGFPEITTAGEAVLNKFQYGFKRKS